MSSASAFPSPAASSTRPRPSRVDDSANDRDSGSGIGSQSLGILLGFLGAFVVLVAFGYARRHLYLRSHPRHERTRRPRSKRHAERPEIFHVRLDDGTTPHDGERKRTPTWDSIMPVSAWIDDHKPQPVRPPPRPEPPPPFIVDTHTLMSQAFFSGRNINEIPRPPPPTPRLGPPQPPPAPRPPPKPPTMNVAVLIAMPSPSRTNAPPIPPSPSSSDKGKGKARPEDLPRFADERGIQVGSRSFGHDGEYVLGLACVPWEPKDAHGNMDGRNMWAGVGDLD